ncbi:hypothetical protein [Niveibacterium sp. SC-1]|uniref:hypothetical protein n=1 Tax=Niveibacterium sp. SC-1 TaxID=3135646 RepID=UPI00311F59B7
MSPGTNMRGATEQFLANVMALEGDAARHYAEFARRALDAGNADLEEFFAGLTEATRMEAHEAGAEGGRGVQASLLLKRLGDSDIRPRRATQLQGRALDLHLAISHALELKRRCHAYYASVAALEPDTPLRRRAQALETESALHLAALEGWIVRLGA